MLSERFGSNPGGIKIDGRGRRGRGRILPGLRKCSGGRPELLAAGGGEEDTHKKSVQKMEEMISRNPENFSLHRPFNAAATRTFVSFIRQNTGALKQDKIPREKLLFVAKDIERSLLELAYFEIVKTTDPGYEKTLKEILTQTAEHKKPHGTKNCRNSLAAIISFSEPLFPPDFAFSPNPGGSGWPCRFIG